MIANAFTLASKVLHYLNAKDYEDKLGQNNVVSSQAGYIFYGISGSSISIILYFILMVFACCEKSCGEIVDLIIYQLTIYFQFALGASLAVELRNQKTSYDTTIQSVDTLAAAGATNTTQY